MEREDIIYNDYLKIKKVYDKLTSKQSEILNREIECSEKIKLLKQEISFKTNEFDNEDEKRKEIYKKKKDIYMKNLLGVIGTIGYVSILIAAYLEGALEGIVTDLGIFTIIILLGIGFAFVTIIIYGFIYPMRDIIYVFLPNPYLEIKYKKIDRSLIKELNKKLEIENNKLKAIEDKHSINMDEVNNCREEFKYFLRSV